MKIRYKLFNGVPKLAIQYEGKEWAELEKVFNQLGLVKTITERGFGVNQVLNYYQSQNKIFSQFLSSQNPSFNNVFDDINRGVILDGSYNISIFRVVPEKGISTISLNKYSTILELRDLIMRIKEIYTTLFNLILDTEIDIKITEKLITIGGKDD